MLSFPVRDHPSAIGYVRVSTNEQADHGASLDAQRENLRLEAERRGWTLDVVVDSAVSAKTLRRPSLQAALARLDAGEADFLLASRLDRVSRSVADFAALLDRAAKRGWGIVFLSPNIDTSDAAGRFTANVLASAAQYERELIGARTREGKAQRRAEGVRMGRPRRLPLVVYERVLRLRSSGASFGLIARTLAGEGVPTASGSGRWHASTIRTMVTSLTAAELALQGGR